MSEQTQADRSDFRPFPHDGSSEPSSRFVPLADGRVARFDPVERLADPVSAAAATPEFETPSAPRPNEMLAHARMLIDDLGARFSEMDRRERILADQLQQLDRERRDLKVWKQEAEAELQSKEDILRHREATLAEQIASQQAVIEQLRAEQTDLAKRREMLESDRIRLLAEVGSKVAAERERLQQALAAADADRQARQAEFDRQQQLLDEVYRGKLLELDAAKSQVRQDVTEEVLTAELRTERESLIRERTEFDSVRSEFFAQRDRERADLDQLA